MTIPESQDPRLPIAHLPASDASRIDAALAGKPTVQIPADFAARVAALAAAQPRRFHRVPQIGRRVALLLAPFVAIALFLLAPHSSPSIRSIIFDTEMILIAQLAACGWLFARQSTLHYLHSR